MTIDTTKRPIKYVELCGEIPQDRAQGRSVVMDGLVDDRLDISIYYKFRSWDAYSGSVGTIGGETIDKLVYDGNLLRELGDVLPNGSHRFGCVRDGCSQGAGKDRCNNGKCKLHGW